MAPLMKMETIAEMSNACGIKVRKCHMSEAIWIAIIVAGASLITQLIISWVQPFIKSRIERKEHRRVEICKCFSNLFGLLAVQPAAHSISALTQKDRSEYDKSSTDKWFFRFNSLLWEMKTYIENEDPELYNALQRLSDIIADIYELKSRAILLTYAEWDTEKVKAITTELLLKEDEYSKIVKKFTLLSVDYTRKL